MPGAEVGGPEVSGGGTESGHKSLSAESAREFEPTDRRPGVALDLPVCRPASTWRRSIGGTMELSLFGSTHPKRGTSSVDSWQLKCLSSVSSFRHLPSFSAGSSSTWRFGTSFVGNCSSKILPVVGVGIGHVDTLRLVRSVTARAGPGDGA
jgi:hypothetical protein